YHYAPDPSSQGACTIGGNVATNSGGPHTLKYGVTVNHILGLELVLPDGRLVTVGGPCADPPGYDLTGTIVGSEGTFGLVTKVWVRVTRNPEAYRTLLGVFDSVEDATNTISDIIGAGIVPAALEMLDNMFIGSVVVARTKLPQIMRHIRAVSEKYRVAIANVFHAGDGNIHPVLLFDERDPDQVHRVLEASHEILDECIRLGGSVTGEHGIGVEKLDFMPKLFAPEDLLFMLRLRTAFNPENRCSPGKMLPTAGGCAEPGSIPRAKPGPR